MLFSLKSLWTRDGGSVAIPFGLAATVLVTAAAAAVDYSALAAARTELQNAADSAALSGARALVTSIGQTDSQREQLAVAAATSVVSGLPAQKAITPSLASRSVTVTLTLTKPLVFGSLLGPTASTVQVVGSSTYSDAISACVVALGTTEPVGIEAAGSSTISAPKCTLWSNATSVTSVDLKSTVAARRICAAGGKNVTGSVTPSPETYCNAYPNPFAAVNVSSISTACTQPSPAITASQTVTLMPGVYCGPLTISGTATFEPGLYVIKDGLFKIDGQAQITGTGVSILLSGNSYLFFTGKARMNLSAMSTGPLAGIVIASDPNGPALTSDLRGDVALTTLDTETSGSIYLPNQRLTLSGAGKTNLKGSHVKLVARSIAATGNNSLIVGGDDLAEQQAMASLRLKH